MRFADKANTATFAETALTAAGPAVHAAVGIAAALAWEIAERRRATQQPRPRNTFTGKLRTQVRARSGQIFMSHIPGGRRPAGIAAQRRSRTVNNVAQTNRMRDRVT